MLDLTQVLPLLRQPFAPSDILWLVGRTTSDNTKCIAMPYADLRSYQEVLDEIVGADWSVQYLPWGAERCFCNLTILGITRSSSGEMSPQDVKNDNGGTVAEAQAFKRAGAMFGLGRYLYNLPALWVAYDASTKKIAADGKAELERRYLAWYTKTVAAHASRTPVADPDPEPVSALPPNSEGDALFTPEPGTRQAPRVTKPHPEGSRARERVN